MSRRRTIRRAGRRSKRVARAIARADEEIFDALAGSSHPVFDRAMLRLTQAATYSRLWMAISAVMGLFGGQAAWRAALRGLASIAAASLVTNQGAKRLAPRRRPNHARVPRRRKPRHMPTSSSMPSGHTASAAAFATGVALEHPALGAALAPLATAVGVSRVATGAHYPSDVVVGGALGVGVAGAIALAWRPRFGREPVRTPITDPALVSPVEPHGTGIVAVVNPASGSGTGRRILGEIERELPGAELITVTDPSELPTLLRDAAARGRALAVGGGDGTVAAAASVAIDAGVPLVVFPGGTFNNFARAIGCPTVADTIAAVREGRMAQVDVGRLNGDHVFLNTASIGAYPQFVRMRERYERKIGKPLAAAYATLHTLLHEQPVRVLVDGEAMKVSTLFLGASTYELTEFGGVSRPRLDDGVLDLHLLRLDRRLSRARLIASSLFCRSERLSYQRRKPRREVRVAAIDGPVSVATDGEIGREHAVAHFSVQPRALTIYGCAGYEQS